jgi:transketolase
MQTERCWRELAQQLRVDCLRAVAAAGSGHAPSALSAADLMAVLLHKYLCYDFHHPKHPGNDHLVFSKGHAAPLLYGMLKAAGAISDQELLTLRQFGSCLEGHPTPRLPWVEVATGSLGQGLPIAVGMALSGKRLDRIPFRVWVLCGDGELSEGSMWEAFEHAAFEELDNLTAIVDVNRFGQAETRHGWDSGAYIRRAQAFGWHALEVDGHDLRAIDEAYAAAVATFGQPTVIVARTVKGRGVAALEDNGEAHSKPMVDAAAAIRELGGERHIRVEVGRPPGDPSPRRFKNESVSLPRYQIDSVVSLRQAYGETLVALGAAYENLIVVDADVGSSTFAHLFAEAHPERFFQSYIAEQQMMATAVGLQALGYTVFASTFAAFLSRAYDFVRMATVSRAQLCLAGSHPGVSIGPDGPSQMGLEDLAAFRALHGSTVLYPSDANQASWLVRGMAEQPGVVYLRVTRAAVPVLYDPHEPFRIGASRVLRASSDDKVAIVGAGITLHEALRAANRLAGLGVRARVIDLYSIKPVDEATLQEAALTTGGRLVTVEDHRPEGGLGDAVLGALAGLGQPLRLTKLAVTGMPGSGAPSQQLRAARIDAGSIVEAALALLGID